MNAEPRGGFTLLWGEAQKGSHHRLVSSGSRAAREVGSVRALLLPARREHLDLAQDRRPRKSSDGLRVAQVTTLDGPNYHRDRVPDLHIRSLMSQMMPYQEPDAGIEKPSQLVNARGIAVSNSVHESLGDGSDTRVGSGWILPLSVRRHDSLLPLPYPPQ